MTDQFPEAFDRFEDDVDTREFDSFPDVIRAFQEWARNRAPMTRKQTKALGVEARDRLGIKPFLKTKYEVYRTSKTHYRFRDPKSKVFRGKYKEVKITRSVKGKPKEYTQYQDAKTGKFIRKPELVAVEYKTKPYYEFKEGFVDVTEAY